MAMRKLSQKYENLKNLKLKKREHSLTFQGYTSDCFSPSLSFSNFRICNASSYLAWVQQFLPFFGGLPRE